MTLTRYFGFSARVPPRCSGSHLLMCGINPNAIEPRAGNSGSLGPCPQPFIAVDPGAGINNNDIANGTKPAQGMKTAN
jgi:hypothetical protein